MSTTESSSVDTCDGENLAILLGLYWLVYIIVNAVIFVAAMYGLRKCLQKPKRTGQKNKGRSNESHTSSRISLVSSSRH